MEIVVINFSLDNMTEDEYLKLCDQVAPAFAAVEGLHSKVWLADAGTNTYGGVYTFESPTAVEKFLGSQLFADVGGHPNLKDARVSRFRVLEDPTRITRGFVTASA